MCIYHNFGHYPLPCLLLTSTLFRTVDSVSKDGDKNPVSETSRF
jgi:hypothetical protein